MCSFLIQGYIWGCAESVTFWEVVCALPAGFSSWMVVDLDTQTRFTSVPPFELGVEQELVMEFFMGWC